MGEQRTLWEAAERPVNRAPLTIGERFAVFHERHPDVYRLFKQFALELLQAGRTRYSADAILHRVRWNFAVGDPNGDFRINDHWSSRYARMLMDECPAFRGFFETRRIKTP